MTHPATGIAVVQIDSWKQYPWLHHGFSTRFGGVSTVYGENSLNLGWTKEDDPNSVRENRRRFLQAVTGESTSNSPFTLVGVRQIHSTTIHEVRDTDGAIEGKLATPDSKPVLEGDGLITDLPGVLIAAGTADCVPVLVADTGKRVVAAFHAGWRGTVARIVEAGIATLQQSYGSRPEDLIAAVGPSIGPCCYSVGDEVRTEFASNFTYADHLFRNVATPEPWRTDVAPSSPSKKQSDNIHLDLWEANRRQLKAAGFADTQITVLRACTACSRAANGQLQYFSHRGERGVAGRMLNAIGIANETPSQNKISTP